MNCEEYKAALHDYALGKLAPERAAQVDEHRSNCPHCVEFNAICEELLCRDFVQFLDDYVDDSLLPERRAVFERHLSICDDCVNYLESYRRTIELGVESAKPSLAEPQDDSIPSDLIKAILDAAKLEDQ